MSGLRDDLIRERSALRSTLVALGPDAPTAIPGWTAADLAVHVVVGEINGGIAPAPFRVLVGRGVRIDRMASANTRIVGRYRRRHDLDWALDRLAKPPPRAHTLGPVAPVSLLEVWAHHEDLLVPSGGGCESGIDLTPVIDVLVRYQRRPLERHGVRLLRGDREAFSAAEPAATVTGSDHDIARWLTGRAGLDQLTVAAPAEVAEALAAERLVI